MPPKGYKVPFKVRKNGYENYCTYEWLEEHYVNKRLSCRECAELYGCSESQIKDLLKECGIYEKQG